MGDAPRPPPGRTAPEPLFDFYSPETYKDYHGVLMVADDGTVAPWDGYDEQMHTMGLDETRDSSPTPSFCISAVDLPGIELSHESIAYLLRAESPSPSPPPLCGVPPPARGSSKRSRHMWHSEEATAVAVTVEHDLVNTVFAFDAVPAAASAAPTAHAGAAAAPARVVGGRRRFVGARRRGARAAAVVPSPSADGAAATADPTAAVATANAADTPLRRPRAGPAAATARVVPRDAAGHVALGGARAAAATAAAPVVGQSVGAAAAATGAAKEKTALSQMDRQRKCRAEWNKRMEDLCTKLRAFPDGPKKVADVYKAAEKVLAAAKASWDASPDCIRDDTMPEKEKARRRSLRNTRARAEKKKAIETGLAKAIDEAKDAAAAAASRP